MIVWHNGRLVHGQEAALSVYDHGFLYGMGLFETFRTYSGRPFLLKPHLQRLRDGCAALGICYEPDETHIRQWIADLLAANQLADAYIRFTVSAGVDILGLPADDYKEPNIIIYIKPLPPEQTIEARAKPIQRLVLRRNSPEGAVRHKSLHYMNNILAKKELRGYAWAAAAEGVFLNAAEQVTEGIVSNVCWIRGQTLYTPAIETGILPGITRQYAMQLAAQMGLRIEEGRYRWEDLLAAEEVLLTNSIQEIVPVSAAYEPDGSRTTWPAPGMYTLQLGRMYAQRAADESRGGDR